MYIVESPDTIKILDTKVSEFNGNKYYKALVDFPKGVSWLRTPTSYEIGSYDGYSVVIDNGKDMLVL